MRLQDRDAVVTGAASGIGAATARLFAAEGARVLAVDRPGSGTSATASGDAGSITPFEQDVTEDAAPQRIASQAIERLGQVDILVNNAGVSGRTYVENMSDAEWDRVFGVNVRAQFRLCRAVLPGMKDRGYGRIVNVASVMAERTDYGLVAYASSKAGVAGLTRTVALEYGKFGVTANYVLPGPIYTGMTRDNFDQDDIRQVWEKKTAVRRAGQREDIARGILFLASDDAEYVTGTGLTVDGGLTLRTRALCDPSAAKAAHDRGIEKMAKGMAT
ncbi:MAG: SDR family NAD(P)-dependent oxidoreductase [Dehalococcoidia bacterium]|nr:SDR family NAD(P)-dependent oxidoreductase [Dehalococcoidia bacterium]